MTFELDAVDPRRAWLATRTFRSPAPDGGRAAAAKKAAGLTVDVCLPALNEGATVGSICTSIHSALVGGAGLVDRLIVIDSGSDDDTAEVAEAAGAEVYRAAEILPEAGRGAGKGEALWKSLAVTTGDIICWLDSDVTNFDVSFVTRLVEPLIEDSGIMMVKGFYERPAPDGAAATSAGGRLTELVARPLLNLLYPDLAGLMQPLAGEYAARRNVLLDLSFFPGYAVEIGLLLDIAERFGADAIAQADLGVRIHSSRDNLSLGKSAHEIMGAMLKRLSEAGRIDLKDAPSDTLVQFAGAEPEPIVSRSNLTVRPPMRAFLASIEQD
jgi:glucosyl-3-phosphoglycerate synthase